MQPGADAEERVDNRLMQIWKLMFGQYFAADVWLMLWSWILVQILKMNIRSKFL